VKVVESKQTKEETKVEDDDLGLDDLEDIL
jgi:hypothetical protein